MCYHALHVSSSNNVSFHLDCLSNLLVFFLPTMSFHSQHNIPVSSYSSLSGGVPSPIFQAPRAILPANRVLLPQPTWTPSGFAKVDAAAKSAQHITFDMVGAPAGFGMSVMEIAARGNLSNWIQRADDLLRLNTDKIYLRIYVRLYRT